MLGDVEVNDTAPVVGEHEEHEQNAEPDGGHREEVDGDQALEVIVEERPPTRARRFPVADHAADLRCDCRPATFVSALPGPVVLEALPVPADHGRGLDNDQGVPPSVPGADEPEPEDAVSSSEPRPPDLPSEHDQLLAEGEILESVPENTWRSLSV